MKQKETAEVRASKLMRLGLDGFSQRGFTNREVFKEPKEKIEFFDFLNKTLPRPEIYTYFEKMLIKTHKDFENMTGMKVEVNDIRVLKSFQNTIANNIVECEQSKKNTWYSSLKPNMFGDYYEAMVDILNQDIKKMQPYSSLIYHTIKSFALEQYLVTQKLLKVEEKQVKDSEFQTDIQEKKEQLIQTDTKFIKEQLTQTEIKTIGEQSTQIKVHSEDAVTQTKPSKDLNLVKKNYLLI